MAKVKNKRNAGAADRANQKRKAEANKKKLNPFEVHINREKHHVLGKKSKHDRGLPGVSRAKAIQKRKETLGTEMKLMHKSNTFIDKRIGEKDTALSAEDRMVARFAAERAKQHGRKNIYNLADDEVLTHRGQTLEQIEKFDDPRSDEEDEAGFKGLDDDFVSEGHFGGGVLSKSDKDGAKSHKDLIEQLIAESKKRKAEKQKEKEQTLDLTEKLDSEWKDLQPVVFKRARVEEESAIDKVLNKAEKNSEDYDKMMRELRFEKRGVPSDAIKTDEKLEREEQERIARLEKDRERRMLGDHDVSLQPTSKHRSADDLDDNFQLDDEPDFMLAYDKDGKPLVPDHIFKANSVPKSNRELDDGLTESSDDDDEDEKNISENDNEESEEEENDKSEDVEESEESNENEDQEKKIEKGETTNQDEEKGNQEKGNSILFRDSESSEEGDSDSDDEVTHSKEISKESSKEPNVKEIENNAESSGSESSDEEETITNKETLSNFMTKSNDNDASSSETTKVAVTSKIINTDVNQNGKTGSDDDTEDDDDDEDEDDDDTTKIITKTDNSKKTIVSQESDSEESSDQSETSEKEPQSKVSKMGKRKKLIGDSEDDEKSQDDDDEYLKSFLGKTPEYENLKKLLSDKTPSQQSTAVQKLIKSYDPSLGENNKEMLSKLFANMLQYVNDLFTNLKEEGDIMKSFLIMDKIAPYFYDINQVNKVSSRKFFAELLTEKYNEYRKRLKKIPDLDTLVFFKLISLLYPTSDFRHPITTPSLTFMSQILTTCRFRDAYSISRGMFVTTLVLEYTTLSKRYVPAAVNFIRGILYLSAKTTVLNPIQVVPPFRLHKDAKVLILEDDCSKLNAGWKMELKDLVADTIDNAFKIRTVLNATLMLKVFFDHCNEMEAQECIFEPHIKLLSRLELELYPKKVASTIEGILKYMKDSLEVKTYKPLSRETPKAKTLRLYEPDIQEVFTGSKSGKLSRELAERQRLEHRYKREMKGALREIRRDKAYVASVKIKEKIQSDKIRQYKVKQIYKDASIQQGELNKLKRGK